MKDENRIEALEQELKILKNEIQSTLLEIREQILNHYYPELRAEEPLRSLSLPVRHNVGRPGVPTKQASRADDPNTTLSEITAKGQVQPFSDIFLEDLEDEDEDDGDESLVNSRRPTIAAIDDADDFDDKDIDDDDDLVVDKEPDIRPSVPAGVKVQKVGGLPPANASVAPKTREVDFRQLKQGNSGVASTYNTSTIAAPNPAPQPARVVTSEKIETAPPAAPKANRLSFAALASWVSDGVTKVGKERTLQVVETYATGGKLTNETKNSLTQLIALADDADPAPNAGTQEMLALMVGLDQILHNA